MRTRVYIDGFNLYCGALKDTQFKWLNQDAVYMTATWPRRQTRISSLTNAREDHLIIFVRTSNMLSNLAESTVYLATRSKLLYIYTPILKNVGKFKNKYRTSYHLREVAASCCFT